METKTRLTLLGIMLGTFAIGTDFTGAMILVPAIENAFSTDITTTQWVLNIYALSFAMFMVPGGRLGDMHGHRRVALIGFVVFAAASFGCAASPSINWLIAARALQGLGAALLWPCLMAKSSVVIKDDPGLGVGFALAGVTLGNVIGPPISGAAVSIGDWWLFFVAGGCVALMAMVLSFFLLEREDPKDVDERIDVSGMVVLAGAVLALLVALDQGADWGWASAPVLGLLVVSICLLAVFPLVERQVRDPLLPMDLLSNRPFLITLAGNGLCVPAFFIAFLYFPQYMTKSLNWTTWNAALGMVPLMVLLSVGSVVSGRFYKVLGPKRLLCIGFLLLFAGCLAVLFLEPAWGYLGLLLPVMLIGLGATLCVGPAGTASIAAVQEKRAGLAGGLSFTTHLICGAVGVAAATAILYDTSRRALEAGLSAAGITLSAADQKVLIGNDPDNKAAQEIFAKLSAEQVDAARTLLIDAFASGLSNAYWVAVVAAFFGLVAMLMLDEDKLRTAEAS